MTLFHFDLRDNTVGLAVQMFGCLSFLGPRCDDYHAARYFAVPTVTFNPGVELANVTRKAHNIGLLVQNNIDIVLDPLYHIFCKVRDRLVLQRPVDVQKMSPQHGGSFNEMDPESLVGQSQSGGHSAEAAANDKSCLIDGESSTLERGKQVRSADSHFHQLGCLLRRHFGFG